MRHFRVGQHYRGSIGGSLLLTPKGFPVKISPTLDLTLARVAFGLGAGVPDSMPSRLMSSSTAGQ